MELLLNSPIRLRGVLLKYEIHLNGVVFGWATEKFQ